MPHPAPNWSAVRAETVRHLQALIRLNTVNPPGNEVAVARYVEGVLTAAGIETAVVEDGPGKAALRATLRGTGADGGPLLLLAHMDVVPVEADKWTVPPFDGLEQGGHVYGRGAIDDKGMLACHLVTMLLLKRHVVDAGLALTRDVALVATSDEETGGAHNIDWVAREHPELLAGEDAINEGGRVRVVGGRPLYAAIQCAEKVSHVVHVIARGPSGHSSVPLETNALWRLGRALAALGRHRDPLTVLPTTRDFFGTLAAVWPDDDEARAMLQVASDDARAVAQGEAVLAKVPTFDALLRAGVSATMLHGGDRPNVIPGEVRATLNVRTLPGQHVADVVSRLRKAIADPLVDVVVEREGDDAPCTPHGAPVYEALADSLRALDHRIAVVPYLSTGATDSARMRRLGVRCYGILPFPLEPGDEARMHGHDERVPVEALLFGVQVLYGAVRRSALEGRA